MAAALPPSRMLEQEFGNITRSGIKRKPLARNGNPKTAENPAAAVG